MSNGITDCIEILGETNNNPDIGEVYRSMRAYAKSIIPLSDTQVSVSEPKNSQCVNGDLMLSVINGEWLPVGGQLTIGTIVYGVRDGEGHWSSMKSVHWSELAQSRHYIPVIDKDMEFLFQVRSSMLDADITLSINYANATLIWNATGVVFKEELSGVGYEIAYVRPRAIVTNDARGQRPPEKTPATITQPKHKYYQKGRNGKPARF